jgi:hypothetical protein
MKTKNQKTLPAHGKREALLQRDPAYDEIALAAYYIWEDRGRPDDNGVAHWLEAEAGLQGAQIVVPFEL